MEAENINVDEYVFQLELGEETTKIEAKEEAQCSSKVVDMNMVLLQYRGCQRKCRQNFKSSQRKMHVYQHMYIVLPEYMTPRLRIYYNAIVNCRLARLCQNFRYE